MVWLRDGGRRSPGLGISLNEMVSNDRLQALARHDPRKQHRRGSSPPGSYLPLLVRKSRAYRVTTPTYDPLHGDWSVFRRGLRSMVLWCCVPFALLHSRDSSFIIKPNKSTPVFPRIFSHFQPELALSPSQPSKLPWCRNVFGTLLRRQLP